MDLGCRRSLHSHRVTHGRHGTSHYVLIDERQNLGRIRRGFKAHQRQEIYNVLYGVDDGRGRQEPLFRRANTRNHGRQRGRLGCEPMRLITDDTRPLHDGQELRRGARHLVADQVDLRRKGPKLALDLPLAVANSGGRAQNRNAGARGGLFPLRQDGHRSNEERVSLLLRLQQREKLDRLAETHLVAHDPAAGRLFFPT